MFWGWTSRFFFWKTQISLLTLKIHPGITKIDLLNSEVNDGDLLWRNSWSWYPKPCQDVFLSSMNQDVIADIFIVIIIIRILEKPPERILITIGQTWVFSEKSTCTASWVYLRWFWCLNLSSGIFMDFEKHWKFCPLSPTPSKVHTWGSNTKNFQSSYIETPTKQFSSLQLLFRSNVTNTQKGVGKKWKSVKGAL